MKEADPKQRNHAVQVYRPTERAERYPSPKKKMEEHMDRTGENVVTDRLQPPPQENRVKSPVFLSSLTGRMYLFASFPSPAAATRPPGYGGQAGTTPLGANLFPLY